jgi:hypothetical protein
MSERDLERPAVTIVAQNPQHFQSIQDSLTLFWPDPPEDIWLVVSWLDASGAFPSAWFRYRDLNQAVTFLQAKAQQFDVYVGMGLRHATCQPVGRGTSNDVGAVGGLWVELDHSGGVHTAKNLPTSYQLMRFIGSLPFEFSLLINSTGGIHAHLLFKELWILDTPAEHAAASLLLRRLR